MKAAVAVYDSEGLRRALRKVARRLAAWSILAALPLTYATCAATLITLIVVLRTAQSCS